jgi:hypothetical protein
MTAAAIDRKLKWITGMAAFNLAATVVVLCLLCAQASQAADITVLPPEQGLTVVLVTGALTPGDYDKFKKETALLTGNIGVVLVGPGGHMLTGIGIGSAIRMKGWETRVPMQQMCASACALAWLGGLKRTMFTTSRVGFHASFTVKSGQPDTSSSGNAVVGGYLRDLNFGYDAIAFLTKASPRSMVWLTPADIQKYDLKVNLLEDPPAAIPQPQPPTDKVAKPTPTPIPQPPTEKPAPAAIPPPTKVAKRAPPAWDKEQTRDTAQERRPRNWAPSCEATPGVAPWCR